ncbi:MAG: FHA domain-containing protein [Actinomycetota bacterium]|nr:FHA domain-containing protein [Actinomycetota bacterium]
MAVFLEIWTRSGVKLVPLDRGPVAIGKRSGGDVVVDDDRTMSRLHAVVEPVGSGWCIRDLGSRNGTFVNGQRIWAQQALHRGDQIRVGSTRIVFRDDEPAAPVSQTVAAERAPELTRRERDVLMALCRPLLAGGVFREPASVREMAGVLMVSEAAVKQHLSHLYDKFSLYDASERRRVRLANEALARGAVSVADVGDGQ